MNAVNQARVIAQIGAEVSAEGLDADLAKMAGERLKGQVPSRYIGGSVAQALADAAAKTAVAAVSGLPEAAAKEALESFKAGAAEYVDLVFEIAKEKGLFA